MSSPPHSSSSITLPCSHRSSNSSSSTNKSSSSRRGLLRRPQQAHLGHYWVPGLQGLLLPAAPHLRTQQHPLQDPAPTAQRLLHKRNMQA